ncbi:FHA domain-containing protein [Bifidobacterium sp. ESL0790]|uniref:FHA domain-containing protein n=1 Tax=Bifidobacterium sp. ESL0790 TaxID=2983233 RepID=UPI0023F6AB90|nr:FHA domain-containing protein [Bifidobacterium sp. ESL0790]WEV72180.1 FHA domain-containing protein [Bifidobacterium sp. ESL0790]
MADQRTAERWVIKVNGGVQVGVGPGQDVEIGRHPLRPLADDGHRRVEIADSTRSMSKRHALFSVSASGEATLEDRNSTNGTYVLDEDGNLTRLAPKKPFILQTSPMRMQFGDVPVDFVKVEADSEEGRDEEGNPVTDLFDYAASRGNGEPEAAEMSVDDILNLRAGEPTMAFKAADVAGAVRGNQKAGKGKAASTAQTNAAQTRDDRKAPNAAADATGAADSSLRPDKAESQQVVDSIALDVKPKEASAAVRPRDLFQDALVQEAQTQQTVQPGMAGGVANGQVPVNSGDSANVSTPQTPQTPGQGAATSAGSQVSLPQRHEEAARPQPAQGAVPAQQGATAFAQQAQPQQAQQPQPVQQVQQPQEPRQNVGPVNATYQPVARAAAQQDSQQSIFTPMYAEAAGAQAGQVSAEQGERNRFMRPDPQAAVSDESDATNVFEPAFEPGSVFERVSKGEFSKPAQVVEVEGLNSNDAKVTTDFAVQFEMAKHPELLPFLAMNPGLYDDLYAWLGSLGNQDIDAALSHNSGYAEYQQAQGTGMQA